MGAFGDMFEGGKRYASKIADVLSKSVSSGAEMYGAASQPAPPEVVKGVLGFTPGVGDVISAYDAYDAARQGNYGEAALNAAGVLPFVPALGGVLKPGKYPSHGWSLRGDALKKALSDTDSFVPSGVPEKHQEHVISLIDEIKNRGLLPFTDVDKGGSVYVSAFSPIKKTNGDINFGKKPESFGKSWQSGYNSGKEVFQARFADHGQFYSGPTLSIDPQSGNDLTTAKQMLEYFLGSTDKRPRTGKSYIIPSTGEQGAFK